MVQPFSEFETDRLTQNKPEHIQRQSLLLEKIQEKIIPMLLRVTVTLRGFRIERVPFRIIWK